VQTPDNWKRITELFGEALEREGTERQAYLDRECAGDMELRREIESLLEAHKVSDGLSKNLSMEPLLAALEKIEAIGSYRLIRKVGEGGMGQVWLAEQTSPVRRQVALKLLAPGAYNYASMQRFELERQSLAMMEHPAIAKVFDAGYAPDGRPYFVMEYVAGLLITDYCDQHKLTVAQRVELFKQVCDGVQHAHQKAIVHRDLKPSNILVTEVDGKPVPRIIDFGIAKPISLGAREDQTIFTQAGSLIGTPGFMSPEQLNPNVSDIDTRTDVYSLGVLLYTLLTGSMPFSQGDWRKKPIDEILREVREQEPPSPSTRVANSQHPTVDTAELRGTSPEQLVSALRGDLDWITLKAMEKDRERRYASPSDLAADLQRYLESRPVHARPASASYRLRKYIRRNRVGVAIGAGALALLVAFAIMQSVQLRRITRERDRANRITDFMTRMFELSDPSESRGNSVTVREVLDKASKEIDTGLAAEPQLRAQMMVVMGSVYRNLGLYPQSESLLTRAYETRLRILGPNHADTIAASVKLAATLDDEGKLAEAEKLLRSAVEAQRRLLSPDNKETLLSTNLLASTLHEHGQYAEAEKMYRQILETQRRLFGPDDPTTLTLMSNVAAVLSDSGSHSPEIEQLDREVLAARKRILGADHPDTLRSMCNLGIALTAQGNRTAEADQILSETLAIQRRVLGPEHPDTLGTMGALTSVYELEYRYAEEEKLCRETIDLQRRVVGPENVNTISAMANLAGVLALEERYAEAEQLSRQTLEIERRMLVPDHYLTLQTRANFLDVLESERKLVEAEKLASELLETEKHVFGPEHPVTLQSRYSQAKILKDEGKLEEAAAQLLQTREIARRVLGPENPRTASFTYTLAGIAALQGKRGEAISLLQEALDHGLDPPTAKALGKEPDLKSLHGDPRFDALVARGKQAAGAAQK
jgi:serine/threonine protein kinase